MTLSTPTADDHYVMAAPGTKPYSHPARQLTGEDRAAGACTACGAAVIGLGPTLRHADEAFKPDPPKPADSAAYDAAISIVADALDRLPPWETSQDRARAAVAALYTSGALRVRRDAWKPQTLRSAA